MEAVNLKKLAKHLNLSVSTVSRALRDSYEISTETKERVLALATELNYQPNPYASSLRKHKSKTIAVVVPEIANNFFSLVINGIEAVAQERGYHVLIYLTHEDFQKETAILRHLQSGRVDGVMISLSSETNNIDHLVDLQQRGLPIVFFDRVSEQMETAKVTTDDYESGIKATEHLLEEGCKRIAYLLVSENLSIGVNRMQGYKDALLKNKIPIDNKMIVECSNDNDNNFSLVEKLLSGKNRPDGIFASVEKLAITSYHVCRKLDLSIPSDVKIIGFSNLETASLLNPSLTTITQPAFNIGKEAAGILFKALQKNQLNLRNEKVVLQSTLMKRDSTRNQELGIGN